MRLLALDASSTTIGWLIWNGNDAECHGTITLKGDIDDRICLAETVMQALIDKHAPDGIALEGPTTRFASHVIAQQRVVGVILLVIRRLGMVRLEIAPSTAKKALTGKGNAGKPEMIKAAGLRLEGAYDEHVADALGVALGAWGKFKMEGVAV